MKITPIQTVSTNKNRKNIDTTSFLGKVGFKGQYGEASYTYWRGTSGALNGIEISIPSGPYKSVRSQFCTNDKTKEISKFYNGSTSNYRYGEINGTTTIPIYYADKNEYVSDAIKNEVYFIVRDDNYSEEEIKEKKEVSYQAALNEQKQIIKENQKQIEEESKKIDKYEKMKTLANTEQLNEESERYTNKITEIQKNIQNKENKIKQANEKIEKMELGKKGAEVLKETTLQLNKAQENVKLIKEKIKNAEKRIALVTELGYKDKLEEETNIKIEAENSLRKELNLINELNKNIAIYKSSTDLYKEVTSHWKMF